MSYHFRAALWRSGWDRDRLRASDPPQYAIIKHPKPPGVRFQAVHRYKWNRRAWNGNARANGFFQLLQVRSMTLTTIDFHQCGRKHQIPTTFLLRLDLDPSRTNNCCPFDHWTSFHFPLAHFQSCRIGICMELQSQREGYSLEHEPPCDIPLALSSLRSLLCDWEHMGQLITQLQS